MSQIDLFSFEPGDGEILVVTSDEAKEMTFTAERVAEILHNTVNQPLGMITAQKKIIAALAAGVFESVRLLSITLEEAEKEGLKIVQTPAEVE